MANLLKFAQTNNLKYDYYHHISGVDMPLKTPNEIDEFFKNNAKKEFIHFFKKKEEDIFNWRMNYQYPL